MTSLRLSISAEDSRAILTTPAIFATVAEDGMDNFEMPEGYIYLCGYADDVLIGCFILHKQSRATLECHVQVLPEFREKWAAEFGDAVIQWTWDNTDAKKIVAQIPFIYPNVKDFAMARGFKVEGINSDSYLKNGELHSQWYVGIKRWDS